MNKFWLIVGHTYSKHFKSKSFWISTFITIGLIAILANLGTLYTNEKEKDVTKIGVLGDESVRDLFIQETKKIDPKLQFIQYKEEKQAKEAVLSKEIQAYVLVKEDQHTFIHGTYKAKEIVDQQLITQLTTALNETKKAIVIDKFSLDKEVIEQVNARIALAKEPLIQSAKQSHEIEQSFGIIFIGLILIYATVVFYGNIIATEVASEKASRVMEVLVSSVAPTKQMFGKVIGLALLTATQYLFYALSALISFRSSQFSFQDIPTSTFVYGAVFVTLGYFLYATLLAMLGSLVSRIEDVNQLIAPVNVLIVIAFILSIIGMIDPTTELVTYGSFVPFFAPMLMFVRVAILSVPAWQIGLSIGLLIGAIVSFAIIGAKVYKGGVLLYGKTSYKSIIEALRFK